MQQLRRFDLQHRSFDPEHEPVVSPLEPTISTTQGPVRPSANLRLATASCMDLNQQSRDDFFRQSSPHQRSRSSVQQSSPRRSRPVSYTSPVSPGFWQDEDLHYQQQNLHPPPETRAVPEPLFSARQRRPVGGIYQRQSASTQQRRPAPLQNLIDRREASSQEPGMDRALLYPQRGLYDEKPSFINFVNVPVRPQPAPRTVSQPNTSGLRQQNASRCSGDALSTDPRSPTYPPADHRRVRSTTNVADATFTDDEEFHLFVQATAGLGPDIAYQEPSPQSGSPPPDDDDLSPTERQAVSMLGSEELFSPIQETPTTRYALRQLAQLPQASVHRQYQQADSQNRSHRPNSRAANADFWINTPEEDDAMDEQLPDYAQSQAEAQYAQRIEATRRAQELQRRWQQSR